MKTLLISASPRHSKSCTLGIAKAFLKGTGEEAELIDLYRCELNPCLGCIACWFKTPGQCVQRDDAPGILEKIQAADTVIWSAPLYFFGVPSQLKTLFDRMMPRLKPSIYLDEKGRATHPGFADDKKNHILITSGAFPDVKGNFDGVEFQFQRIFGYDKPMIACCEATLFAYKKSDRITAMTTDYLKKAEAAGKEYKETGTLSAETLEALCRPMMDREEFIAFTNGR